MYDARSADPIFARFDHPLVGKGVLGRTNDWRKDKAEDNVELFPAGLGACVPWQASRLRG